MVGETGSDDLLDLVFGAVHLEPPRFESNPVDQGHISKPREPVFDGSNDDESKRRASVDSHMTSVSQQRYPRRVSTASSEATSHTSEDTLTLIDEVVKAKTAAQQVGAGVTVVYQSDIEHNVVNELVRIEKLIHDQQVYNDSIDGSVVSNKNGIKQVKTGGSVASTTHSVVKKSSKAPSAISIVSNATSSLSETVFNPNGITDDEQYNEHDVSEESHRIQNIIDTQRRASEVGYINGMNAIVDSHKYHTSSLSESQLISEHVEKNEVFESHGAHIESEDSKEVAEYADSSVLNGFHTVHCSQEEDDDSSHYANSISHHITEISHELVQQDAHGNITSRQSVSGASGVARSDILSEHSVVRSPLTDSLVKELKNINGLRHTEDDDDDVSSIRGSQVVIPYDVELSDSDNETIITLRSIVQKEFDSNDVVANLREMTPKPVPLGTKFEVNGHNTDSIVEHASVDLYHVENESHEEGTVLKTETELEFQQIDFAHQDEEHDTIVNDEVVLNDVDVITAEHDHNNTYHYNAYDVEESTAEEEGVEMKSIPDFDQHEENFLEDHSRQALGASVHVHKHIDYEDHSFHSDDHINSDMVNSQLKSHSFSNASQEEEFATAEEEEDEDEFQRGDIVPSPFERPASPSLNMPDSDYAKEGNLTIRLVPHTIGPKVTETLRSVSREELLAHQARTILHHEVDLEQVEKITIEKNELNDQYVQPPIYADSISANDPVNVQKRASTYSVQTGKTVFNSQEYILNENVKALRNRFENGNIDNHYDEEVDAVFKQLDNTLSSKPVAVKSRSGTTSTVQGSQVSAANETCSVCADSAVKHIVVGNGCSDSHSTETVSKSTSQMNDSIIKSSSSHKSSSRRSSKSGKSGKATMTKSRSTTLQNIDEHAVTKPTSLEIYVGPPVLPILSQTPITSPNYDDKHQSVRVVKSVRQFVQKWGSPDFVPPSSPVVFASKRPQSPALVKDVAPLTPVRTTISQPRRDSVMSDATSVSVHSSVSQKSAVSVRSAATAKSVSSNVSQGTGVQSAVTNTTFKSSKVCSHCGRCGKRDGKKVSKSSKHQKRSSIDSNVTITEETTNELNAACNKEPEVTEVKVRAETVVLTKLTPVSERRIMFEQNSSGLNRNFSVNRNKVQQGHLPPIVNMLD